MRLRRYFLINYDSGDTDYYLKVLQTHCATYLPPALDLNVDTSGGGSVANYPKPLPLNSQRAHRPSHHHPQGVNTMTWESPPLHRQLSTIGIGEVFISVPTKDGSTSSCSNQINQSIIQTSEIVCDIKRRPEDFIVREIGISGDIAGVTKSSEGVGDTKLSIDNATKVQDNGTAANVSSVTTQQSSKSATNTNIEVTNIDTNPDEGLQRILTQCCTQDMKDSKSDQHVQKLLEDEEDTIPASGDSCSNSN